MRLKKKKISDKFKEENNSFTINYNSDSASDKMNIDKKEIKLGNMMAKNRHQSCLPRLTPENLTKVFDPDASS